MGLKVVEQYDYSRIYRPLTDGLGKPFQGERARPLQTLIWYPAEKSNARPMTVGDYAKLQLPRPALASHGWRPPTRSISPYDAHSGDASMGGARRAGGSRTVSRGHLRPKFSGWSWQNADLCEYLTSHGYVVIASQSAGERSREMTQDVAGINAQARDISFLIGYAQMLPDTDMAAIAVAGFSWGGISNLFAAARDNRIDALVGLDGSMRYFPALVKQAGDVHPEQMTIPLLFFTQGEIPLEASVVSRLATKDQLPSVLNAWTHGDLITVHMLGFVHDEFSSILPAQ